MSPTLKNALLAGAAAVILIAAVFLYFRPRDVAEFPTEYVVQTVCLETKQEMPVRAAMTERAPFVNPSTGRRTLYPWWFCWECKYRFVPTPIPGQGDEPPRIPPMPACPHCGSANTGSWVPEDPDAAQPAGDAPLPELPK